MPGKVELLPFHKMGFVYLEKGFSENFFLLLALKVQPIKKFREVNGKTKLFISTMGHFDKGVILMKNRPKMQ